MPIDPEDHFEFEDRSTLAEWDRFDAELGAFNRNDTASAWILSDRDVWYANPFYQGPPQPHPEDYDEAWGEANAEDREVGSAGRVEDLSEDEIPF